MRLARRLAARTSVPGRRVLVPALLFLGACRAPVPQEVTVEFRTDAGSTYAVSTELGVLALNEVVGTRREVPFRYVVGNGQFDDVAAVTARGAELTLLAPVTSRPNEARFASAPADATEHLFVEFRRADGAPELGSVELLDAGRSGDLVRPSMAGEIGDVARRLAGAGLFAWREGHLQLVGVLNGVYCESPRALGFIGMEEIAAMLPQVRSYFDRVAQPYRADFEYGIPRDFAGERPHASGLETVPPYQDADGAADSADGGSENDPDGGS